MKTELIATRRWLLGALAVSTMIVAGIGTSRAQDTLERIHEQGYVRIGFANEAPYGYATPDGRLTGEAPEIAKAVLAKMGINEVDGVLTEFGSLIPGLKAGRFDVIAAGMFVTPKRCEQIAFSEPTYGIGQAFLVKEGNPKNLGTYGDIAENPDAKLGVMAGAIEKDYAVKSGVSEDQILTFPDGPSGLAAVQAGRVDAFALTSLSIGDLVAKAGPEAGVERAEPFGEVAGESVKGHGAFGFRKEDTAFLEAFNEQLAEFIGSPEHLELVEPFGFGKSELPVKTTAELCAGK